MPYALCPIPYTLCPIPRLKRLWDFLRLELHLHVEPESEIAAHCLNLNLGSLADSRLDNKCDHHQCTPPPPLVVTVNEDDEDVVIEDVLEEAEDMEEECCKDGCSQAAKHHCKHCATSFCTKHLELTICRSEYLPQDFGKQFVCTECSPKVEATSHKKGGCATCDEVHFFKLDVMKCAVATADKDILGRAESLCECIDIMVAYVMRTANQVRVRVRDRVSVNCSVPCMHIVAPGCRNGTGLTCLNVYVRTKSTTTCS